MFVSELEELIERNQANVAKAVELETGIKLEDGAPVTLIETLNVALATSLAVGVSYHDISDLKVHPELQSLTARLNPNDFSLEPSFCGVNEYRTILKAALGILQP